MPTYEAQRRFERDFQKLSPQQRAAFRKVLVEDFIPALNSLPFPPKLRVKRVVAAGKVWEMTWAPDGRATFQYGPERTEGEPHVIWRRVGTHAIFKEP
ncbi:MAG TPA: hypothetical protein VGH89_06480 [Pseudonocardia sp.]|jgi:hypothetical protein